MVGLITGTEWLTFLECASGRSPASAKRDTGGSLELSPSTFMLATALSTEWSRQKPVDTSLLLASLSSVVLVSLVSPAQGL